MSLKLQRWFLLFFAEASVAVWQHITLKEGQTLILKCPIKSAYRSHVEWRNPFQYVMFFNGNQALKDKRYSIVNLSNKEFTVSVTEVTFKDGGLYTCFQYNHNITTLTIKVTVLGEPKLEVAKHGRKTVIKCTGEGNNHPPQLYWQLGNQLEIEAEPHYIFETGIKKYSSVNTMIVQPLKRVTVKCIIRHPDLHGANFMRFINIEPNSKKGTQITSTKSPPLHTTGGPTELQRTSIPYLSSTLITKGIIIATHSRGPTTGGPTDISTVSLRASPSLGPSRERLDTSTKGTYLKPTSHSETLQSLTTQDTSRNETIRNSTSTTAWLPESMTRNDQLSNGTEGIVNSTKGDFNEVERQITNGGSARLLVFLVTCLIFTLLVVVIFLSIRLRRAHILWKKENEDSGQSEESSKSKSSHEEKQSHQQRRKGLFNIGFTKYVIEEPTERQTTESTNTSSHTTTSPSNKEVVTQESQCISPKNVTAKAPHIKETEL